MTESADSSESETTQIDPALADQVGVSERRHTLNDGHQLPQIGMGTYPMDDADAEVGVYEGINRGFRLIDTAVNYGNEIGVGRGIALAGLPRDEVFVTTKIPGRDQGDEATVRASGRKSRPEGRVTSTPKPTASTDAASTAPATIPRCDSVSDSRLVCV